MNKFYTGQRVTTHVPLETGLHQKQGTIKCFVDEHKLYEVSVALPLYARVLLFAEHELRANEGTGRVSGAANEAP
jgi:hypothetical protein